MDEVLIDFSKAELKLDPLTPEQEEIVILRGSNILVDAGPASGKTRLTVNFAKSLIISGVDPDKILMLSFTKIAVKVLKERLLLTERSTLHSHGFRHSEKARNQFLRTNDFDTLLVGGDKKYEWVICDEAQDLTQSQFNALTKKGKYLLLVGDKWQSIYTWAGAKPELMDTFCENLCTGKRYPLTVNHRSRGNIVEVGNRFSKRQMEPTKPGGSVVLGKGKPKDLTNLTVLLRTNKEVKDFSMYLKGLGVPHTQILTDKYGKTATNELGSNSEKITLPNQYLSTLLCTIHASKGEEWDRVWVEYLPPNTRDLDWKAEEKLFYVAITRAKEELYVDDLSYRFIRRLTNDTR